MLPIPPGAARAFTLYDLQEPGVGPITASATVTFVLKSAAGTTVASEVAASGGSDDWTATLTMPTTAGRYTLEAQVDYGGVVSTPVVQWVQVGATLGVRGTTLRDLRRDVGDELNPTGVTVLVCTQASTPPGPYTTFKDENNLFEADGHFVTQVALVSRGHDLNTRRTPFVTGSSFASRSLTLDPALPAPFAVGDEVELWGQRGAKGFRPDLVERAINRAIRLAGDQDGVPLSAVVAADFDPDSPTITLPDVFDTVHEVQFLRDSAVSWVGVPHAETATSGGWWAAGADGAITVQGGYARDAEGGQIRVFGRGQPDELTDDDERTEVDRQYVVATACANLLRGGLGKDPLYERKVGLYERKADALRLQATPFPPPGSVRVR